MKTAILVDGDFLKRRYQLFHDRYPSPDDIYGICHKKIMTTAWLEQTALHRIYFYDCPPYEGTLVHPISGEETDYSRTTPAQAQSAFLHELARKNKFCLRSGELTFGGWRIPSGRVEGIVDGGGNVDGNDLVPDFRQKQVDVKMSLDIASLALKKHVDIIVIVGGDSDLIPALEFAREEGLTVYVAPLGQAVKYGLLDHSDGLLSVTI